MQGFSRDVEREIFRVDDTLDEVEIFRSEVFAIIHDENTADVEIKGSALRGEDYGSKFELTSTEKCLTAPSRLVESVVLLSSDTRPLPIIFLESRVDSESKRSD